jgi:hypothetical protein
MHMQLPASPEQAMLLAVCSREGRLPHLLTAALHQPPQVSIRRSQRDSGRPQRALQQFKHLNLSAHDGTPAWVRLARMQLLLLQSQQQVGATSLANL